MFPIAIEFITLACAASKAAPCASLLVKLLPIAIAPLELATEFVPIAIVFDAVVIAGFASFPKPILPSPVVTLVSELSPIVTLPVPVVKAVNVVPKPMLLLPVDKWVIALSPIIMLLCPVISVDGQLFGPILILF